MPTHPAFVAGQQPGVDQHPKFRFGWFSSGCTASETQRKRGTGGVLIFNLWTMSYINSQRLTGVSTSSTSELLRCLPTTSAENQPVSRQRVLT